MRLDRLPDKIEFFNNPKKLIYCCPKSTDIKLLFPKGYNPIIDQTTSIISMGNIALNP